MRMHMCRSLGSGQLSLAWQTAKSKRLPNCGSSGIRSSGARSRRLSSTLHREGRALNALESRGATVRLPLVPWRLPTSVDSRPEQSDDHSQIDR